MSLTLVTTPGAYNANSYISLADAETVMEGVPTAMKTVWAAASNADKNAALVQATRDIDTLRLLGDKYYTETDEESDDYQALHFPVSSNYSDSEGGLYIPAKVEEATVIQAHYLLRCGYQIQQAADTESTGVQSVSIGNFSTSYRAGGRRKTVCDDAMRRLGSWVIHTVKVERS